jgi:hypothetical protein
MLLLAFLSACEPPDTPTDDKGTEADADTDTDADSDTDSDTDADTDTDTDADTGPSFSGDVYPVYRTYCGDCHESWGGYDASRVYTTLLEGELGEPFVVPGDRAGSWMYDKIANDRPADGKDRMPVATELVDDATLGRMRDWITAGANDDATWQGLFFPVWYDRHCHNCHEEWGEDSHTVLANLLMIEDGAYPLIDPGNPDNSLVYLKIASDTPPWGERMPIRYDYLDAHTIERIGQWIDAGALDN